MKKILNFLFSFPFMGFMLLVLAFSMAIATFVESSYGTEAAQGVIYKSLWFEAVLVLLAINLMVNFIRYKMYTRHRIAVGLFHIAFIVILIGAGITRFISFEGVMHIRQGQTSDYILSSEDYLTLRSGNQTVSNTVLFSELSNKSFEENISIEGRSVNVKSVGFIKNAVRTIAEDPSGTDLIDFVLTQGQGRENYVFEKGNRILLGNLLLAYNVPDANFQFMNRPDGLYMACDRQFEIRSMTGGAPEIVNAHDTIPVQTMHLYAIDSYLLLVKKYYPHAIAKVEKDPLGNANEDAVQLEINDGNSKQLVNVFGRHNQAGEATTVNVGNTTMDITYGAEPIYLPFALQLRKFELEKYPGSDSPASFASELTLIDQQKNVNRNVRVFMNNTLNYRGYKFFQSSYDQDELGTVLSVNADQLGTSVTYIGYLLLALGFVLALFSKTSHFSALVRRLQKYSKPAGLVVFAVLFLNLGYARADNPELAPIPRMNQTVLDDFSRLWIQGQDGRIEPVSTLSSEILRKVTKKSSFYGFSPEEVMLGLYIYPEYWRNVSLVAVSDPQLKSLLGVTEDHIPLISFFDQNGNYKLVDQVKEAYNKMPVYRNMYDKEIINVDERVNICFMVINGDMFAVFPGPDKATKWFYPGTNPSGLTEAETTFVSKGFQLLKESMTGQGQITPAQIIASIASYQTKYGSAYLPSDSRKEVEIFYNKLSPFKTVFPIYLTVGLALLVFIIFNIFRQKTIGKKMHLAFTIIIGLGFLLHIFGLILRWYISGHAPWSNGYESMVYVSFAAMLAGMIFGRKYPLVLGTGAMLAGILLLVAHMNWMNPEITNLVPVLNSYWLMIHVADITASYGFIGLGAFIGILVLILYSISNAKNSASIKNVVLQLTTISEMSVTIGLYMLTIGTFLGGVWANESWGRYWGWDPKETWALISVVIYSFIAHMRMIPSLSGIYKYTVASVLGFASIAMTYFGVNYYLSGLHSYGRGTVDGMHWSVYAFIGFIVVLLIVSNIKKKNLNLDA